MPWFKRVLAFGPHPTAHPHDLRGFGADRLQFQFVEHRAEVLLPARFEVECDDLVARRKPWIGVGPRSAPGLLEIGR